jgi:predicted nuclease of restriction endonuclease-like (RecB) superfamily
LWGWQVIIKVAQCFALAQSDEITKQVVSQLAQAPIFQIPWGQNLLIISKASSTKEALFYVQKTIGNNWSRAVLTHQIELELYQRQGKAFVVFVRFARL